MFLRRKGTISALEALRDAPYKSTSTTTTTTQTWKHFLGLIHYVNESYLYSSLDRLDLCCIILCCLVSVCIFSLYNVCAVVWRIKR